MKKFSDRLKGGNLRSLGNANQVIREVKSRKDFDELFDALFHNDRKVVMRAADAIEKITVDSPQYLQEHKKSILQLCFDAKHIELKWHLALLVTRVKLTAKEMSTIWQLLNKWAKDKKESKIVRVNSLQGQFEILKSHPEFTQDFTATLNQILRENIPSLNARIKKLENMTSQL